MIRITFLDIKRLLTKIMLIYRKYTALLHQLLYLKISIAKKQKTKMLTKINTKQQLRVVIQVL